MKTTLKFSFSIAVFLCICWVASGQDIHEAPRAGDLERVKELIGSDPGLVNARSTGGSTPLHYAATSDVPDVAEFLLSAGASVNEQNDSHYTPLHYAAAYDRPEVVKVLAEHGASLELKSLEGETPLHMGAMSGAVSASRVLMGLGANINAREDRDRTALLLTARESGDVAIARLLVDEGADINAIDKYGSSALELAAWRGYGPFVDYLLEAGALIPIAEDSRYKLFEYSIKRTLELLFSSLLGNGVDLSAYAVENPEMINQASAGGSVSIVSTMMEQGFSLDYVDSNGWSPLHCAAEFDRVKMVEFLLDRKSPINARTRAGQSAYNIALEEGSEATAILLISKACDTGPPDFPEFRGAYLGQPLPGNEPEPFAPGIVSAHSKFHSSITFSPDNNMAAWSVMVPPRESGYGSNRILMTGVNDGKWSYPAQSSFNGLDVPFFSPEGKRLYYLSREPAYEGGPSKENIWYVEHREEGWSDPKALGQKVNDVPLHWQFSIDREGTLYMGSGDGRILVAQKKQGQYLAPVEFGDLYTNATVEGGSPFIAPDGDYLIFSREGDLYITFRKSETTWTEAVRFDDTINTAGTETCPVVSPDGDYLFYNRGWTVYWVAIREKLQTMKNLL